MVCFMASNHLQHDLLFTPALIHLIALASLEAGGLKAHSLALLTQDDTDGHNALACKQIQELSSFVVAKL